MKRSITVLLAVFVLLGIVLTACTNDVVVDELVSVSFEEGSARALSATLEAFAKDTYYWKYAARKNTSDASGLNSGKTTSYDESGSAWIHANVKGLDGKVSGFSQGIWDFTLFAYKDAAGTNLVYTGEAKAVTLKKGSSNTVSVVVSPASSGNGTLKVGTTTLDPKLSGDVAAVSRYITVSSVDGSTQYTPSTGTQYTLATGRYKVTVSYKSGDIIYAEGNVIATVYPGLTTTVTGNVTELVTYAQFDATQNENIITVTAGVDGITSQTTGDTSGNIKLEEASTETDKKVSATLPVAAAKALLPQVDNAPDPNATMSLALNVDTKDSTSTTVTYEISMTKTVTVNSESTTSDVSDLGKDASNNKYYATATVKIGTGLTGVTVTHDGHAMVNSTDTSNDGGYGIYSYDSATGVLTIKTNTFSPFQVSYDGNTAGVAEVGGTKYATVAEAFAAATSGQTIKLLENADGAGLSLAAGSKTITLDLNGKTYTVTKDPVGSSSNTATQGLHLEKGNTVTIKNGKITSAAGSGVKMLIQNYSNLTLQDVELDGSNIGAKQYTLSNNYGTISITGSTSIKAPENGYAFDAYFWPKLSYDQVGVTVNTTGKIDGTVQVWSDDDYETYGNSITIQNGIFTGSIDFHQGNLSIVGGTFTADPRPYLADGYEASLSNNVWVVGDYQEGEARIGETLYSTIEEAISAATESDVIYLLKNINRSSVLLIGKSVNIEGNCRNITGTAKRVIRITAGNCDVKLNNLGIVSKCTASSDVRGISFDDASAYSKLTLDGCVVSASFYAINAIPGADNLTVTIKNGTVAAGWAAINSYSNNSTWTIEDSVLKGLNDKDENAWNNFNTINFDGDCLRKSSEHVGECGSGNTISLLNSTVYGCSNSSNTQHWLGLQYGALNNNINWDDCYFLDQNGEDISDLMLLGYYCNYSGDNWDYYQHVSIINGVQTIVEMNND